MLDVLKHLLDYLSGIVDPARQAAIERRHRQALDGEPVDRLPLVVACPLPEDARFKPLPYREAFADPERMLYNELIHAFDTSIALRDRLADDLPLTVRANFGTVLIALMFGAKVEQHADNPPWVRHTETGIRPAAGMAPAELKAEFGDRLCFSGGVDDQNLLPRGKPDEVRAGGHRLLDVMAPRGGFFPGPTHNSQDDIPTENILAMYEAARQWDPRGHRVEARRILKKGLPE